MKQVQILLLILGMMIIVYRQPLKQLYYLLVRRLRKLARGGSAGIFEHNYIDAKAFYLKEFSRIPCITFIDNLVTKNAYEYITNGSAGKVRKVYQHNYFNWQRNEQVFITTLFLFENAVIIELGDGYAQVLFGDNNYEYAQKLVKVFSGFKAPEKDKPFEINIITAGRDGLDLKPLEIRQTELDIDMYYNDDFKEVDEVIRRRLGQQNDKGIILLHGLPGTGKTTYLRHLVGCLDKKVLFVSPGVAANLMNPDFIDLLIGYPNAILIIEDAENIIMDRRFDNNSSVSNLLNISDGLLSDCLNVQIICTFNSTLSTIDSALMRKGRLIARYEFGKLSAVKAQRLSDHFGFNETILHPMSVAEIANPGELDQQVDKVRVMGFRREEVMVN